MRKFIFRAAALCAAASVGAIGALASAAFAQVDPFASIPAPRPQSPANGGGAQAPAAAPRPAQPNRVGFTGVDQAVGRSYAGASTTGAISTATIRMLPKYEPPLSVSCKTSGGRNLAGRPKIAVPTYALALVRQGSVRASAAGQGSDITPRATSISTVLIGVEDRLAEQLADEAHADLVKRLTAAGFQVVGDDQLQTSKEMARLELVGTKAKGQNDWTVYGPKSAPLRSGHPLNRGVFAGSGSAIVFNDASVELDAVMVSPYLALDYATYETSGRRNYAGSASAGMDLRFRIASSGANFLYGKDKGKGGGIYGAIQCDPAGTDELFGVMFEIDDRSDDVSITNAFAQLGLGSLYRQSKYYGVEAVPDRYAALAKAAYQGFNATLVAEIQKARGQ